ncbi:D-alanyl-D-alanine carboxypeptidase, partial [Bacillus toyonensis]
MALFIAGTSLLYLTPTSIIKTGSTQNILSSLQISTQRDRTSVEQVMRDTLQ